METLKISFLQFDIQWQNKEKNLQYIEQRLNNTSAQLIVLPEMFNTGFNIKPQGLAETASGQTFKWLTRIAKQKNSAICGSIIWQEGQNFYNRLIFMKPDTKWAYYDKRHTFSMAEENKFFTSGKTQVVINYLGWRIKPLICYDLRFPVWARNQENYHLLIYVANWPASRIEQWEKMLMARAIENQAYVIAVNRIGKDGNNFYYNGKSMVLSPKGEIIYQAPQDKEDMPTIELSLTELMQMRQKFPVLNDKDEFIISDSQYQEFW